MADASSRILIDRSVVRLDGRPFFSFGPRILLTPEARIPALLKGLAQSGFTLVGSPPCSPGTLPLLNAFFDAADEAGIMVLLMADPRLPEHGRYLADHFRHRRSLHSYYLTPRLPSQEGLESYLRERDSIRALDLFHPIFVPLRSEHYKDAWLRAQDIFSPETAAEYATRYRIIHQRPGRTLREMARTTKAATPRPLFVGDLRVMVSDEERQSGLYADDPAVARLSPRHLEWFPFLANFGRIPRKDMLGPDPELLRLQVYDVLGEGARGVLLNFYEAMAGPLPFTGHDRFCEAVILAQEIQIFRDFFAEGRIDPIAIETGHPRLRAVVLRHGMEQLIVLRLEGYEEDYFIDEAYMERTEIELAVENPDEVHAWRMDFPEARQLEVIRDSSGSIRFLAGPLELTGLVLLTTGTQRSRDLATEIENRLPEVARLVVDLLAVRFAKVAYIEGELNGVGVGVDNRERLRLVQRSLEDVRALLRQHDYVNAYQNARAAARYLRQVVKYQMAKALATPLPEGGSLRPHLRNSYYTLPRFYREVALESARAYTDLT